MRQTHTARPALNRGAILAALAVTGLVLAGASPAGADEVPLNSPQARQEAAKLAAQPPKPPPPARTTAVDTSGRKEAGKASVYSPSFDGRTTASGTRLNPNASVAASKTLPLGTVAKVTNLDNGKSTEVKVEDRGPFVSGRVVDLTPHAARQIGLTSKKGVTPVVVAPIAIPTPSGGMKPGAGAAEVGNVAETVKHVDPAAKVGAAE